VRTPLLTSTTPSRSYALCSSVCVRLNAAPVPWSEEGQEGEAAALASGQDGPHPSGQQSIIDLMLTA
jgi:hypothetical protein